MMNVFILSFLAIGLTAQAQVPEGCPNLNGKWTCIKPQHPTAEVVQLEITVETYRQADSQQTGNSIYKFKAKNSVGRYYQRSTMAYIYEAKQNNAEATIVNSDEITGPWTMTSKCENNKLTRRSVSNVDETHTASAEYVLQPDGTLAISEASIMIYSWGERQPMESQKICTRN
jgi:hypothetical protein